MRRARPDLLWLCLAALPAGPSGSGSAQPQVAPATAALCAGSLEVWTDELAADGDRDLAAAATPAERVRRAHALYAAATDELARADPGAGLAELADQAYFEALRVWTNRREEGRERRADGSPTAKARNARAAHADLMHFLDWCLTESSAFAERYLGG